MVRIDIANTIDLKVIHKIHNQSITDGHIAYDKHFNWEQRKSWFDGIVNKFPIWVARVDQDIAGFIYLTPYREGRAALSKVAEVSYFVDERFKRQGIGKAMLQFVIREIPNLDTFHLIAILLNNNQASIRLLTKCGFAQWGKLPGITTLEAKSGKVGQVIYGYSENG